MSTRVYNNNFFFYYKNIVIFMMDPLDNNDYSKYMFGESEAGLSNSDNPLADTMEDNLEEDKYKRIFFTLNSWKDIGEDGYYNAITEVMYDLKKFIGHASQLRCSHVYEYSHTGKLHVHGIIYGVGGTYYPYEGVLQWLAKKFHKLIGKPRNRHCIAADIQWVKDEQQVTKYIMKQNSYNDVVFQSFCGY